MSEPQAGSSCITPTQPLGPASLRSLRAQLEAADPTRPVVLDLRQAPVRSPGHVAGVLWVQDTAKDLGLALEIITADMVTAEMLDFAGITVPVRDNTAPLPRVRPAVLRPDSAY